MSEKQPEREGNQAVSRPNIVLILVDDMGYSDIGCYGSEIRTPNLDALAADGVRFSQMYNCARCCPTRASLLTGLYPHKAGIGHMVNDAGVGPAYQGYLRDDCATVAEVLKTVGYSTSMSGKWHVGGAYTANRPDTWRFGEPGHPTPLQRGFDRFYGMLGGAGSYFHPPYMLEDDRAIFPGVEDPYYITDAISQQACRMMREASQAANPFFLAVTYTAPHWPLHALPEDIERYRGRYRKGGWDAVRTARHEQLKAFGLVSDRWEISPRDGAAPAWQDVAEKEWEDLRMAVYAAQVDRMDQGVGRILKTLESLGLDENTLVMFLSDNGGCAEFLAEDGEKPQRMRYNIPLPDGRSMRVGNTPQIAPGADDTFASYDLPWANASNTPFRLYKHWVHEGGIATPFIARWPDVTKPGHLVHEPGHLIDIVATCFAAAGVRPPQELNGRFVQRAEGESFLQALRGQAWQREEPIFWEHEGNRAVRDGAWKLVSRYPGDWELYNMDEDRTELQNLADGDASRVQAMVKAYGEWADRCGVIDWTTLRGS